MLTFIEFISNKIVNEDRILLLCGGAIKGANGEVADPISTKRRSTVTNDIKNSLSDLHDSFHEETGKHLFGEGHKALKTGSAFSGSSSHLVNSKISDDELHKHKPTMGDIDTQVPKEHLADLHKHLTIGKKFGSYTVAGVKKHGNEVSILAKHENGQHHQIDFEGVDYHNNEPTKGEQFAHSSSWEDMKHGIKGVSHKQLLNAAGGEHHKFSITHGLATRTDDKKAPAVHGTKDPKEISKTLFGREHPVESFDDVAKGIRDFVHPKEHDAIIDKFAERGAPHAVERLKNILSKSINESPADDLARSLKSFDEIAHGIKKHIDPAYHQSVIDKFSQSGHPQMYIDRMKAILHKKVDESTDAGREHHAAVTLPSHCGPCSHVGHQDLVTAMQEHASNENCHISLSDKASYLSQDKRKEIMQKQSPKGVNIHTVHGAGESIRSAYDKLPPGKKVLHLVGGEERQGMLEGLKRSLDAGKVKEMEGRHFDEVHIHNPSVSRRTTTNGEKTSGTNFRKALAAGDEQTIKDHLGAAYSASLSKHLQKGVQSGDIAINRK